MDEFLPIKERPNNMRYLHEIIPKQEIPLKLNNILKTRQPRMHNIKNVAISLKIIVHLNIIFAKLDKTL